jgi:putative ABC transport system permease protein
VRAPAPRDSWAGRVYGALLALYPRPFRERFGRGMRHAFDRDERAARSRGPGPYLLFWIATVWDIARFIVVERRAFVRHHARTRGQEAIGMGSLFRIDWRDGWRALRATPVVTTVAVVSIALGIGANTALFSIVSALVLKPLPVRAPEQLVALEGDSWTNPIWEALRARQARIAAGAFAWADERFDLSSGGEADLCDGLFASGEMFEVLGVPAARGRMLTMADDDRSASGDGPVAVISHALWQRRYQGREDVIGRAITLDRTPFTIVGIMPAEFFGPEVGRAVDVVIPLATARTLRGSAMLDSRELWWLNVMIRLRPGQTRAAAAALLEAAQPQIRAETIPEQWRDEDQKRYLTEPLRLVSAAAGQSELRRRYERPLAIVMAVVAAALLIACANIANLLLARAISRRHELSVRLALGASRFRLSRQLLAESVILTALGTALGAAIATWGSRALVAQLTTVTTRVSLDLTLDWRVLAFTTGIAAATALLFGLAPMLAVSSIAPNDAIREQTRGGGDRRFRLRSALVVVQVALSLALVVAAGLFARTFIALTTRDVGFDRRGVLIGTVGFPRGSAPADRVVTLERVRTVVSGLPGVAHAAVAFTTPVFDVGWSTAIDMPGTSMTPRQRMAMINAVTPGWFATFGVRLVAGRDFVPGDAGKRVAIVNQTFAARFLDPSRPIGMTFRRDREPGAYEVVGVAQDTVYRSMRSPMQPTLFLPFGKDTGGSMVAVKTAGVEPLSLSRAVAEAIRREAPEARISFRSLEQQVGASVRQERVVATLAAIFGGLALLLAGLGLYGVASYAVSCQRAEIGIRMALGATPSGVVRLVLRRLVWMVAGGVAIGTALSLWAAAFVGSLLYGLQPRDPVTFAGAAVLLVAIALAAGWLPARRASRIDPTVVLRES